MIVTCLYKTVFSFHTTSNITIFCLLSLPEIHELVQQLVMKLDELLHLVMMAQNLVGQDKR